VLWDRDRLVEALFSVKKQGEAAPAAPQTVVAPAAFPDRPAPKPTTCLVCGVAVSEKVERFCLARPQRFDGRVYCYEHQQKLRRVA
jgi:restriction system protein